MLKDKTPCPPPKTQNTSSRGTTNKNIVATESKILSAFIEKGRNWFSVSDTFLHFPELSENAIHIRLTRMSGGQPHAYCDNDFGKEKIFK